MSEPTVRISWDGGGEGTITRLDDDRVEILSTRAFPPGSRPEGALASGSRIRLKSLGSRREGDVFHVRARLLDATRALRDEIARSLSITAEKG